MPATKVRIRTRRAGGGGLALRRSGRAARTGVRRASIRLRAARAGAGVAACARARGSAAKRAPSATSPMSSRIGNANRTTPAVIAFVTADDSHELHRLQRRVRRRGRGRRASTRRGVPESAVAARVGEARVVDRVPPMARRPSASCATAPAGLRRRGRGRVRAALSVGAGSRSTAAAALARQRRRQRDVAGRELTGADARRLAGAGGVPHERRVVARATSRRG